MPAINGILSDDPVLQKKVNFVVDSIHFNLFALGRFCDFELDTPIARIDKILLQLERNSDSKSKIYIENHLVKLLSQPDFVLENISSRQEIQSLIPFSKKKGFKLPTERIRELANLEGEWHRTKYLDLLFFQIEGYFSNEPVTHKRSAEIFQVIKLLCAVFLIQCQDKQVASKYIRNLFTNDYRLYPYPAEVNTSKQRVKYFNSKTFANQLSDLKALASYKSNIKFVYFTFVGISFEPDYIFNAFGVRAFSFASKSAKLIVKRLNEIDDDLIDRLKLKDKILLEIPVDDGGLAFCIQKAQRKAEEIAIYFSKSLDVDISVNKDLYFYSIDKKDFAFHQRFRQDKLLLKGSLVRKLEDNPFKIKRLKSSHSFQEFIKHDLIFQRSIMNKDVSLYWHYLEIQLHDAKREKEVQKFFASALLLNEIGYKRNQIQHYIRSILSPINSNYKNLGLTRDEMISIFNRKTSLVPIIKKVPSDFLKLIIRLSNQRKYPGGFKGIYDYWISIACELYEYRNMEIHAGVQDNCAQIKLQEMLPIFGMRIRWVLYFYMKRYPKLSFLEVVERIKVDAEEKCNSI